MRTIPLRICHVTANPQQENQENSSDEVDLVAWKPVVYEMRQSTPGVQYVKDGEPNWTPVVRKRKRKRKRGKTMHTKESTSSSDSELDIGTADCADCYRKKNKKTKQKRTSTSSMQGRAYY